MVACPACGAEGWNGACGGCGFKRPPPRGTGDLSGYRYVKGTPSEGAAAGAPRPGVPIRARPAPAAPQAPAGARAAPSLPQTPAPAPPAPTVPQAQGQGTARLGPSPEQRLAAPKPHGGGAPSSGASGGAVAPGPVAGGFRYARCPRCGRSAGAGAFCEGCGGRVVAKKRKDDAESVKTCRECGHRNGSDKTRCINCGTRV